MTAPSPNGQSPDAVREAVARHTDIYTTLAYILRANADHDDTWIEGMDECVDAIIAKHIAPLLAQRDAAIARAEEAERQACAVPSGDLADALVCVEQYLIEAGFDEAVAAVHGASCRIADLEASVATLTADLAQAKAQVAGMRAALEPFAEAIDRRERRVAEQAAIGSWVSSGDTDWADIELGDLRRARAALTLTEHPHDD